VNSYACITAAEWRNLCSRGWIRIHESRAMRAADPLDPDSCTALFAVAADRFALGETCDFLIAEFGTLRSEIEGVRSPGHADGVRWLLLEDVVRFFPLRQDDTWAFEADAEKARVVLTEAAFEQRWDEWFRARTVDEACITGLTLVRALGLESNPRGDAGTAGPWITLARGIAAPGPAEADAAGFPREFLRHADRLFDLVREDADSGAIFVSCPVEWTSLLSGTPILDSDAELAEQAHSLHAKYRNMPFRASVSGAEDLAVFYALLQARAADAFPDHWKPAVMSLYVLYSHRIRFGAVAPGEIVDAVRAIEALGDRRSAELLAFLLGVTLGPNKTHSLQRQLHPGRFATAFPPSSSGPPAASPEPSAE
jgi:hypothetical protein